MLAPYQTDPHPAVSCLKQQIDQTWYGIYPLPSADTRFSSYYFGPLRWTYKPSVQIKNPDMKTKLTFKFYRTVKTTFQIT